MDLIRKIKNTVFNFQKFLKNKKFREEVKNEKSKKYLFAKNNSKVSFFDFYKNKKRGFSQIFKTVGDKGKKFRVHFILTGSTLIMLSLYIIFISPYFRISPSKVIIERLDTITDINIAYKGVESVYSSSIFLIDKEIVRKNMTAMQKNLKNIEISRLFPNGLKIILESYMPQFYTRFSGIDKGYIVTSNGVLIYEKNIDKKLYNLEIIDQNLIESGFFDYKEGVNEIDMKKIILLRDLFKNTFSNKNISKFVYFKLENEIHISLESGTNLIFELNNDLYKQMALLKFYNDTNKDILNSGEVFYIDIRITGKVFSCKDKNLCRKNLIRVYGDYYKQ
ncbi:MAG: hypothetical protein PHS92_01765 [Candidatus Gracilibacteria bacterium]|nr:hypothetical protein [Candidatus Gracilibacteria bacterium]